MRGLKTVSVVNALAMTAYVPELSRKDVEDLFLVRIPLELEVVRLVGAATRYRPRPPGPSKTSQLTPAGAAHSTFVEADLRFQRALVEALDSPRLSRVYAGLSGEIRLSMVQVNTPWAVITSSPNTAPSSTALNRAEPDAAETLMRSHLEGARDALADQFDIITDRPAPA